MFTEVQRVQEKKDVKSAKTLASAVFLTPPEHLPIRSVVMAIVQVSISQI